MKSRSFNATYFASLSHCSRSRFYHSSDPQLFARKLIWNFGSNGQSSLSELFRHKGQRPLWRLLMTLWPFSINGLLIGVERGKRASVGFLASVGLKVSVSAENSL